MALKVDLKVDGAVSRVCLSDTDLTITRRTVEEEIRSVIALEDIVTVEDNKSSSVDVRDSACCFSCVVYFITRNDDPKWATESLTLNGTKDDINGFQTFYTDLNLKFNNISAMRPKRLLVLMNAIAGKRQAQTVYDTVMTPLFQLARITCDLVISRRPKHLIEVMTEYDCKDVDGIIMMGGDGTMSEIINVLIKKAQEEAGIDYNDPKAELKPFLKPIGIIPTEMLQVADRQLRWMRTARYLAAMFLLLAKRMHVAPVEVTLYSREKQTRKDTAEGEIMVEKKETFRQDCCIVMIWSPLLTNKSNKHCINPSDNENKQNFGAYFYEPFGKFEMLRHFVQKNNSPKIKEVKGYALRIKFLEREDKPPESDPRNMMVCIDGEIEDCPKADYYVKTIAHVINAYCSR